MITHRLSHDISCIHGNYGYCHETEVVPGFESHAQPPTRTCSGPSQQILDLKIDPEEARKSVLIVDRRHPQSFSEEVEQINSILRFVSQYVHQEL